MSFRDEMEFYEYKLQYLISLRNHGIKKIKDEVKHSIMVNQREKEFLEYNEIQLSIVQISLSGNGPYDRTQESCNYSDQDWDVLLLNPQFINTNILVNWLQIYYRPTRGNSPVNPATDIPPIANITNTNLRQTPLNYMLKLYNLTFPDPNCPQRKCGPPPPNALWTWYMKLRMNSENNKRITFPQQFLVFFLGEQNYYNNEAWAVSLLNAKMVNRFTGQLHENPTLPTIIINDEVEEQEYELSLDKPEKKIKKSK